MAHLAVLVVAIVVFVVYKVLGNRKIIDKKKSPTVYEFPKKKHDENALGTGGEDSKGEEEGGRTTTTKSKIQ